jgi:hypothetical protein
MKKNYFFFLFMAGIVVLFMLASCKQAKVTEKPLQTVPQQAASQPKTSESGAPHPEAATKMPAIERKNESILLVYKHTGFGYVESYGFDTYVFRLLADPSGQISGGIVYQRTSDGEVEAIHYNVTRSSDEITLAASGADKKSWSATLKLKDSSIDVSGQQKLSAKLDKALVFASTDGNYSESYSIDQAAPEMPSEIKKGDSTLEKGKWTFPKTTRLCMSRPNRMIQKTQKGSRFLYGAKITVICDSGQKGPLQSMKSMPVGFLQCWQVTTRFRMQCCWI